MQRITNKEHLTPDRLSRLVIREEIKGLKFAVRFERSNLILSTEGERGVQIKCELEDESVMDFFEQEAPSALERYGVDALELSCIQVKDNPAYLFPGPVLVLEDASAVKDGTPLLLPLDALPTLAAFFGMVSVPQFTPPLSLIHAIINSDRGSRTILKRIREFPSAYGVASHKPSYYACLGRVTSLDERGLKWRI